MSAKALTPTTLLRCMGLALLSGSPQLQHHACQSLIHLIRRFFLLPARELWCGRHRLPRAGSQRPFTREVREAPGKGSEPTPGWNGRGVLKRHEFRVNTVPFGSKKITVRVLRTRTAGEHSFCQAVEYL
jgi:hypothetical protein